MKAFKADDLWGVLGIMLMLIAIYLVLKNWMGAQSILSSTLSGTNNVFKTLQGR